MRGSMVPSMTKYGLPRGGAVGVVLRANPVARGATTLAGRRIPV
ncbi:hypothetical protein P355_4139 [Burkholderia cenocepacia KC-01]|nr:hypothetical protein P355_4139 [Burkholderia cenocepacia KC-01]